MNQRAFSAIELLGVVAILAILAALLLPRVSHRTAKPDVIQTVSDAHLTEATVAIQALQAATTAHLAQFGSLGSQSGTPLNFSANYDKFGQVLLTEGFIERPFGMTIGTDALVRLVRVSGLSAASSVEGSNGAYDLDGDGKNDVVAASFVVEAVVPGVPEATARALSDRLDGPRLGAGAGTDDLLGQVIYRKPGPDGRTEVHIHILHK